MWKFIKNLFFLGLILTILGAGTVIGFFIYFGKDLPNYKHLASYEPRVLTRIYAGDGNLFAEYATEKRVFVPIKSIPKNVRDAFLVVEDKNFYQHKGLDWYGLVRATINNIIIYLTHKGSLMGGSTITQQVAKNFLLTNERTLARKIKEAILSLRLENTYSKEKILELYLNEIYFGSSAYGVAAAALHYFNKSLEELGIHEVAFLAALPKGPNHYIHNKEAALTRRNWVIARMMEEGLITKEQALEAKKQPLRFTHQKSRGLIKADYFAEEVRRFIKDKFGTKSLYEGGLSVHTTLDSRLQKIADETLRTGIIEVDRRLGWHGTLQNIPLQGWKAALDQLKPPSGSEPWSLAVVLDLEPESVKVGLRGGETGSIDFKTMAWARKFNRGETGEPYLGPELKSPGDILKKGDVVLVQKVSGAQNQYTLEQMPDVEGALIAVNPHTGQVLALSGGFSYARSEFNRATQAMRQTGSAFKPFTYLAALESGYSPVSMLNDAPIIIKLPNNKYWAPRNIERRFFGMNTLRHAVEKSFNLTTVRLAHTIGMKKIRNVAKRFGIYEHLPPHLSAVLGSEETTLLRFIAGYGMLVNGGKKIAPHLIDRIKDRHGKTLYRNDTRVCAACTDQSWNDPFPPELEDTREQVTDPVTAYQMVSILEGATLRGTARRAKPEGQIVGVKTGTSNLNKDVWSLGFSKDLAVGVFVGYDAALSMGKAQTGGTTAAPIFRSFMEKALVGKPAAPFRVPEGAKFIPVDMRTGVKTKPGGPNAIMEVFKTNQGPNGGTAPVVASSVAAVPETKAQPAPEAPKPEEASLGGIY